MKQETEIWKSVVGYEGLYLVSNLGNIKSLYSNKLLTNTKRKDEYIQVGLTKDKKEIKFKIHRIVAEAFISNPNMYLEINHKDEIRYNNNVENLEWCDRKYNINYGNCKTNISKSTSIGIVGKNIKTNEIIKFYGMRNAEKQGFNHSGISEACSGKRKIHKGFIWRYADD